MNRLTAHTNIGDYVIVNCKLKNCGRRMILSLEMDLAAIGVKKRITVHYCLGETVLDRSEIYVETFIG